MSEPFVVTPRAAAAPMVGRQAAGRRDAARDGALKDRSTVAAARPGMAPTEPAVAQQPNTASPDSPRAPAFVPAATEPKPEVPLRVAVDRPAALEPLGRYLDDDLVTDLFVNGGAGLFVDRGHGPVRQQAWRAGEEEVRALAVALIALGGRHIDDATPCVDVRLDGGMRVHAVLPPVSAEGTAISIRVPRLGAADLDRLERRGMFSTATGARLREIVERRENVLITGAAGAGKTTLLAALLASAPAQERIVTIEDVAELRIDHPHHVRLEARQPNLEGVGAIGLARLVREALRMRPDRLVVGECRGDEVRELLSALNTGHDGGAGTVHANGLDDVPARLEALGALAGLDAVALARQVVSAIHWVIHVARDGTGRRIVSGIGRPTMDDRDRLAVRVEELS
ncbi:Putative conjugal transfer protein [Microbacterium lemovicicum]|uniref:Conjugal transfer protein n=1 Tax=Microbacterium lemovicicum TaxID=1072463 RepID=A0A3Q9J128_9MICO|nr:TadA family conjugal transfer-associated ATPase [Microbacterium lemovicicum]AZS37678.1 Putative conjugal transfer protein [Microbacterium lemovicicum]